jgi:membrane protease YdiL (CAAX protease family)
MNNKKIFVGLSFIEIIISIYAIINRNSILESEISRLNDTVKNMSSSMKEYMNLIIENMNTTTIIISAVLGIILALIIMYIAFKDDFKKNRTKLIVFTLLGYVFAVNNYAGLIYLVGLIIALCIKKDKVKKEIKEEKIPELENHKTSKRDILFGIGFILLYFSDRLWGDFIPKSLAITTVVIFELSLIVLALLLYKNDLKKDFNILKNNFKAYFKYCLKKWGKMLLTMMGIGFLMMIIFGGVNESVNQEMLKKLPMLYVIPSAIIMAPIVEEMIFRVIFRKIIRNDTLFIIISALCFGLLHVTNEPSILDALKSSVTYITMGAFLAHSYVKTNNMTTSMIIHCMQNSMASIMMFMI